MKLTFIKNLSLVEAIDSQIENMNLIKKQIF